MPRKPLRAKERTNHKLNPQMASPPGFEPRPHWWETSALTTAPSHALFRKEVQTLFAPWRIINCMQFLSYSMFSFILSLKNLYTLSSIFYKQQTTRSDNFSSGHSQKVKTNGKLLKPVKPQKMVAVTLRSWLQKGPICNILTRKILVFWIGGYK